MGRSVSLFSGYSQKENRTTNYCLLILKLLYEESPRLFASFLDSLGGEGWGEGIGVTFEQQVKKDTSIPDGIIRQRPFTLYVETKNTDWFYLDQLQKHIDSLALEPQGTRILVALSNFDKKPAELFEEVRRYAKSKDVRFFACSFAEFADSLPQDSLTTLLKQVIDEFLGYLSEEGLISDWQSWLDVVNCVGNPEEIIDNGVYMCPVASGAYSHQRCEYFGMYAGDKTVTHIARIRAVVDVTDASSTKVIWQNTDEASNALQAEAAEKVTTVRGEYPTRVFLLGDRHETQFVKDSKGGLQGTKVYFNVSRLSPKGPADLAEKLAGKSWGWLRSLE